MRIKLAAFVLFCCVVPFLGAQQSENWYYGKPIKSISFEGLKNINPVELDGITSPFIGRDFSDEVYFDLLEKIYSLEFFDEVNPVALPADPKYESVILKFSVTERPVITRILFQGNNRIRNGELLDAASLKEKDIYNDIKARLDERAIRDLYLQKGYTNVKVSSSARETADGVELVFTIDEGAQTVISSIDFQGNSVVASKTLKGKLSLKEAGVFNKGAFREAQLESDKLAILTYYRDRGYIDAEITDVLRTVDTESDPDRIQLRLTFVIREGLQYTYGGLAIEGNTIFSTEELTSKIRLKPGDVFNYTRFYEGLQAVADMYYENGYTSNIMIPREIKDADKKEISFVLSIQERPRSHIENIIIRGNKKTKDYVVLREIPLETGDIFSKSKMLSGLRSLYNLQFFSAIVPEIVQGSEENLVDLVISLEEQSTMSVEFGITFSGLTDADSFPISVFAKWQDSNVFGTGQSVSANLVLAPDQQNIELGYTHSWLFGIPLTTSLSFNVTHSQLTAYQKMFLPSGINTTSYKMKYDQWVMGFDASAAHRWMPDFSIVTVRGGISFSLKQNFYDSVLFVPADSVIADYHGKWGLSNSIWAAVSLDDRDINYDPSKGWFASQTLSWTGLLPKPIETEYFLRSDTKGEIYFTLLDVPVTNVWNLKFVLAGYTGFSFIIPAPNSSVSDTNKLYVDGMFNGRGWSSASVNRGLSMWSSYLELRMPVVPNILSVDFFMDAVAVKPTVDSMFTNLTLDDFYFSFGPGVRFTIAQFPLRLLFANTFQVKDGKTQWRNGKGPEWQFVLSFNLTNR